MSAPNCASVALTGDHSWRVDGDDNYEPYHHACEDCDERLPEPWDDPPIDVSWEAQQARLAGEDNARSEP